MRPTRLLVERLAGWAVVVAVLGGCQYESSTDLTITVTARRDKSVVYELRCNPPGGDLPRSASVCEALAEHEDLFFDPPPRRSTCRGWMGPDISIEGRYRGDRVHVAGPRSCDWPDGLGLAVIEAAHVYRRDPEYPHWFELAVARLRCGEDPRLLVPTAPWQRVAACMRDPWDWGR